MITFLSILSGIIAVVGIAYFVRSFYKPTTPPPKNPALLLIPTVEKWNARDVEVLRAFQTTQTGRKFFELSESKIYTDSKIAVADVMHTAHSAGRIAGADALLIWQHNLASDVVLKQISQATGVQVATTERGKSEPRPDSVRSF